MIERTFGSHFSARQLTALSDLFNHFRVFDRAVSEKDMELLFAGRLPEPLTVRNTRTLCYILHQLSEKLLITAMWQAVAYQQGCFVSLNGRKIARNTLSTAKYYALKEDRLFDTDTVTEYIDYLPKLK